MTVNELTPEQITALEHDADMLAWLLSNFRGGSLHMDGTASWWMPTGIIGMERFRARTAREALEMAYAEAKKEAGCE